jgi:hypothetical protein
MYKESKEMKLIRDVRNKHYEETKGMNSTELLNFYKQKTKTTDITSNNPKKIHA